LPEVFAPKTLTLSADYPKVKFSSLGKGVKLLYIPDYIFSNIASAENVVTAWLKHHLFLLSVKVTWGDVHFFLKGPWL